MDNQALLEAIRHKLKDRKPKAVSAVTGVSYKTIYHVQKGTHMPNRSTLIALARYLEIEVPS